jgi:hypothetical protein
MLSRMAQPATTRSALSRPMQATSRRCASESEDSRVAMPRIASAGTMQPSTVERS